MNQYRRIVSYLYKYGNGKKGENTGFVRIDTRPEGIRLHFRIKDLRMMDEKRLRIYFYFHRENRLQLIFVDEFLCVRGNCEYKKIVFPDFTDGDFEKMNGVVILDQQGLLYGSCWDEREITEELIKDREGFGTDSEVLEDDRDVLADDRDVLADGRDILADDKDVSADGSQISIEDSEEPARNKVESKEDARNGQEFLQEQGYPSILADYPSISFPASENTIHAVRMHLKDIPKLPSVEWKLADNAFLKQAYENEKHLLLGIVRMPRERVIWILGVPGIYDNREKYLADMFGFSDYIPLEEREYKTGGKGYWIREIAPVESMEV